MRLILRRKTVIFYICIVFCFEQKGLFTTNPNFPQDLLLFKLVEENKLSDYFWSYFWDRFFLLKIEIFSEIPTKCFKTKGKHSLSICGSFRGEKQFFLIFVLFYWFNKKQLFKQIQIFLWISPFSNLLRKTYFQVFWASFWESQFFD